MKKIGGVFVIACALLLSVYYVSAIDLVVSSSAIQNSYIIDIDEPALYELIITNNGEPGTFEIYSLVGVDISPKNFYLAKGETKKIIIQVVPQESLKAKKAPINFVYKIKDAQGKIKEERLSLNIVGLDTAISVRPESINPKSDSITLVVKNMINFDFETIDFKTDSAFFSYKDVFPLSPRETLTVQIPLDKEKTKTLDAGKYLLDTQIIFLGE